MNRNLAKTQPRKGRKKRNASGTPSTSYTSLVDSTLSSTDATTSTNVETIVTAFQGLLQQYPQHATPIFGGGAFYLRQQLHIDHLEINLMIIGSQSNIIAAGDLYNSVRVAFYRTGKTFQSSSLPYLTSLIGGTDLRDIDKLYFDDIYTLPTQAFDSASGYNVPMVRSCVLKIPINSKLNMYSSTAGGTGNWETEKFDYIIEFVSDSAAPPHPQIKWNVRWFFTFE